MKALLRKCKDCAAQNFQGNDAGRSHDDTRYGDDDDEACSRPHCESSLANIRCFIPLSGSLLRTTVKWRFTKLDQDFRMSTMLQADVFSSVSPRPTHLVIL